jgi:hypothetical protein
LDKDGKLDVFVAETTGAGSDGRASQLNAVSLATGKTLWTLLGTEVGGGAASVSVSTKNPRDVKHHAPDVEFGRPLFALEDLDKDGAADVITAIRSRGVEFDHLLVVSGATGKVLKRLALSVDDGRLQLDQMVPIQDPKAGLTVATSASDARNKPMLLLLRIP